MRRTIERRKEEAVLHHFELAAFSCLKDKLDQLVTRKDGAATTENLISYARDAISCLLAHQAVQP